MSKFFRKGAFFCFTPEVMLATFITEIFLGLYVFLRYRFSNFGSLIVFLLVLLGSFQFAEYQICASRDPVFWSRIGFIIITFLPVLGLHLISIVTGKRHFLKFGYALMAVYAAIFAFVPKAITGPVCGGNYVVFSTQQELSWTYSAYYFGFLLLGIWEAIENKTKENRSLLNWMLAGYGSFMIPMGIVYSLSSEATQAIPSIMCGFALILAFILAFAIAPKYRHVNR